MQEKSNPARSEPTPSGERSSASMLVRCWLEPSAIPGEAPTLRGYVKNLKTGEEAYFKDLDAVGEQIQKHLSGGAEATHAQLAPADAARAQRS